MTMRVTVENADDAGRVLTVRQEDRPADAHDWTLSDTATLKAREKRTWWIHAARRLLLTEEP